MITRERLVKELQQAQGERDLAIREMHLQARRHREAWKKSFWRYFVLAVVTWSSCLLALFVLFLGRCQ